MRTLGSGRAHFSLSQGSQYFRRVFDRFDFPPNFFDESVGADEKCYPAGPEVLYSHETLFTPNPISLDNCFILIGNQWERQFMFGDELIVGLRRIGADSEDDRAGFLECRKFIAKGAGLKRAARGIIPRIKIKDNVLAFEIRERHFATAVHRGPELRC